MRQTTGRRTPCLKSEIRVVADRQRLHPPIAQMPFLLANNMMKTHILAVVMGLMAVVATHATADESDAQSPRLATADETETDYAESRYVDQWLRHPVYGDPSFDSFERLPGNPIHRGIPGLEWPVNGFLFLDPMSGNFYIYVGEYGVNYGNVPNWRCSYIAPQTAAAVGRISALCLRAAPRHSMQEAVCPMSASCMTPDATTWCTIGSIHPQALRHT